ncbi:hypothetical protein MRB53_042044 [Persea americana]|nr:hypothetical protein MRB53_042044 [Persea americana]
MAPFNIHATASFLSAQVVTWDQSTILVETGFQAPVRWFLDGSDGSIDDSTCDSNGKPPAKRRKVVKETKSDDHAIAEQESGSLIPLGKINIDLQLPGGADRVMMSNDDFKTTLVTIQSVEREGEYTRIQLGNASTKEGPVIKIDIEDLDEAAYNALRDCRPPEEVWTRWHLGQDDSPQQPVQRGLTKRTKTKKHYPEKPRKAYMPTERRQASIFQAFLDSTADLNSMRLRAIVSWRDGYSAFPDGAPSSGSKIYYDFDTYTRFCPEQSDDDQTKTWTPADFYESVFTPDKSHTPDLDESIDTPLFPFQKRAVNWMLSREGVAGAQSHLSERVSCIERKKELDAEADTCFVEPLRSIISRTISITNSDNISGGILAEEMGLGKTIEVLALISTHIRPDHSSTKIYDIASAMDVRPSKATLIITPASILTQWKNELAQHAPKLKVYHYEGISTNKKKQPSEKMLIDTMCHDYDVVLTTYHTLGKEVYFATDPPDRSRRRPVPTDRKKSPLIQIQWWRICLDEAQMVESGVTAAARVAQRLPRIHNWAVSGTPVKNNVQDLYGLLIFLRMEPFASNVHVWNRLLSNHGHLFERLFKTIAMRHTKQQIREDIQLPPQKRIVMNMPFTAIENQHYLNIFKEMCDEVGVGQDGAPTTDDWDPEDPRTVEAMRSWLSRLRQTCLHPQVGGRNRKRLGQKSGALRTVAEVLDVMIDQNETNIKAEERALIQAELKTAHVIAYAKDEERRSEKALDIYLSAWRKCQVMVENARQRIREVSSSDEPTMLEDDDSSSDEPTPVVGRLKNNLRSALQLLHVCVYFVATSYYQIKVNESLTVPDSDEFKSLEAKETELYEAAKVVRREVLKDAASKAESKMAKIKEMRKQRNLVRFPEVKDLARNGGIEARRIFQSSYGLFDAIKDITPLLDSWREKMMDILLQRLVDEDDGNEITGDEYEASTKQQDELYVYFDAFKVLHADLNRCILGETAPLLDHEAKGLIKLCKNWLDPEYPAELKTQPHAPELALELLTARKQIRDRLDDVTSVRALISDARALLDPASSSARAAVESELAREMMKDLQVMLKSYTKVLQGLEKEVELFRATQNHRLEFYRQLQEVSDDVTPYKEELDEELDLPAYNAAAHEVDARDSALKQLMTKQRFLLHLKEDADSKDSPRICVICQCQFENGVLTVCGHQYCKECIQLWWHQHRTCPVCKRRLALVDFHSITYKPQELKVHEEDSTSTPGSSNASTTQASLHTAIYSEMDSKLMDQIKSYDLSSSYGTKIDTLARHLLWLREHDPGAKSIVFSQYREFLDVLSTAFQGFKIGHARLGKANAVERFRQDASIDCLLLDAKTDSSGLTLVNATHVFICEPLVQTAVELQAIARVHRIGQTRPTTVWMYLVNDTVEESIYEISVRRRLEHVKARQPFNFAKSRSSTPGPVGEQAIDAANSEQLQSAALSKLLASGKGGGELVGKDDLWQCLFGKAQAVKPTLQQDFQPSLQQNFDREVRAHAAERRMQQA